MPPQFAPATFLAPLIVPIVALITASSFSGEPSDLDIAATFWIGVVTYGGFFAFGYPLACLLRRKNLLPIGTLGIAGVVGGVVVGLLATLALNLALGFSGIKFEARAICGTLGGLVAVTFGLLAKIRWSNDPYGDT